MAQRRVKYKNSYVEAANAWHAQNTHILKWWGEPQDQAIRQAIEVRQWEWPQLVQEAVVAATPEDVLELWREEDPLCHKYAWYNILLNFCVARAVQFGWDEDAVLPQWVSCLRCAKDVREDNLPSRIREDRRLRVELRYCAECFYGAVNENTLNDLNYSEAELAAYVAELAGLVGLVPSASFWQGVDWLLAVEGLEARSVLMDLGARRPTNQRLKEVFGSWLGALIAAGVLPDGAHKTVRGIRSIAGDGHVCLSIAERSIDDWLTSYGIDHEKEPRYPDSNFRGDFLVGDSIIEFFGLVGDPAYDTRTEEKRSLAKKHGLDLIEIYPKDMLGWNQTQKRLAKRLGFDLETRQRRVVPTPVQRDLSDEKPDRPGQVEVAAPEGWYPDPASRETSRWWDGRFWTHLVQGDDEKPYSDTAFPGRTDPPNSANRLTGRKWEDFIYREFSSTFSRLEPQRALEFAYRVMDQAENAVRGKRFFLETIPFSAAASLLKEQRNFTGEAAIHQRVLQGKLRGPGPSRRMEQLAKAEIPANPVDAGMSQDHAPPA